MRLGAKWNARNARLMKSEEGLGTVEIILIIAVIVTVVLIFKDKISELIESLMGSADTETQKVFS
ncbi:multidrug transporter [Paenibacillus sp. PR3]|uniref:Multidrug transporter n=2 Tax=Paenibacillus terricola TaxID=2763503 RepID=A0ABR8MML6_9BACL|nr:multidrug transporter [Paenibacillus terricola]